MKPRKFRAALEEHPWLSTTIRCLSGSIRGFGFHLAQETKWAEHNIQDIRTLPFDDSILDGGNIDRRQTMGNLPPGPGKKKFRAITGFLTIHYHFACHHRVRNQIETYQDDGRLFEMTVNEKSFSPGWTLREISRDYNSGDYELRFIYRITTVGIEGITSKVTIDIFPFPANTKL